MYAAASSGLDVYDYSTDTIRNIDVDGNIYLTNTNMMYLNKSTYIYEIDLNYDTLTAREICSGVVLLVDDNGEYLYFKDAADATEVKRLHLKEYYTENLNIPDTYTIVRALNNSELIVKDDNFDYIYNISTNKYKIITPTEMTGNGMHYFEDEISRFIYDSKVIEVVSDDFIFDRYLLSFDGRYTWFTYENGIWKEVCSGQPSKKIIKKYGMTAAEINSFTKYDYSKLYEDGRDILSVDFAAYLRSVNTLDTPRINSIKIYMSGEDANNYKTYDTKEYHYNTSEYRKINKIYPIEFGNKKFEYQYLFKIEDDYYTYKNNEWGKLTDTSTLFENLSDNWLKVKEISLNKSELTTIPESILTENLTNREFDIVSIRKINDNSSDGYDIIFNFDYAKNYFQSENITLSIFMSDGTEKNITGITEDNAEDILDWLNKRQNGIGNIYYTLKIGNTHEFLNYYMIQSIKVVEN